MDAPLNLGCGSQGHSAFVNVDLVPAPGVIAHDLRQGVPFPDATFDLVYHSTMLSTMRSIDALTLMRECCRVLTPGGVLRVVTEDLEQMCRAYLGTLEAVGHGDRDSADDYEWMIPSSTIRPLVSFRAVNGRYLRRNPLPNEAFIYSRTGEQGRRMVSGAQSRAHRSRIPRQDATFSPAFARQGPEACSYGVAGIQRCARWRSAGSG